MSVTIDITDIDQVALTTEKIEHLASQAESIADALRNAIDERNKRAVGFRYPDPASHAVDALRTAIPWLRQAVDELERFA